MCVHAVALFSGLLAQFQDSGVFFWEFQDGCVILNFFNPKSMETLKMAFYFTQRKHDTVTTEVSKETTSAAQGHYTGERIIGVRRVKTKVISFLQVLSLHIIHAILSQKAFKTRGSRRMGLQIVCSRYHGE